MKKVRIAFSVLHVAVAVYMTLQRCRLRGTGIVLSKALTAKEQHTASWSQSERVLERGTGIVLSKALTAKEQHTASWSQSERVLVGAARRSLSAAVSLWTARMPA
eukprot:166629-Chlamydomonas_euryale.AAC.7